MQRSHTGWVMGAVLAALVCPSAARAQLAAPALDAGSFSQSTLVDNTWFPLAPGTQYVYDGRSDRDGTGLAAAQVVFIVTDVTKVVDGERTVAVLDTDYVDGAEIEREIHFFAQDDAANVWSLGEYPEEYDGGSFAGAPSAWLSGVDGAQAGIHFPGTPQAGSPPYVQGIAPNIGFFNAAQVTATGQSTCVPYGCLGDVVITDEFSPDEPDGGGSQKYYAPGVGNVRIEPLNSADQESLQLTSFGTLGEKARQKANVRTLRLDARAYGHATAVWIDSSPAEIDSSPAQMTAGSRSSGGSKLHTTQAAEDVRALTRAKPGVVRRAGLTCAGSRPARSARCRPRSSARSRYRCLARRACGRSRRAPAV